MKIVKYCKSEHNIQNGCGTLQLGTYKFYREMDSSFSIADENEGFVHFKGPKNPIFLTADQLTALTGGAMQIIDSNNPEPKVSFHQGTSEIKLEGGNFIIDEAGVFKGSVSSEDNIKLFYPNSYIFCAALLEDDEKPDPKSVSADYDSFYEINADKINLFIQNVSNLIISQLTLDDVEITGNLANNPMANRIPQLQVNCIHRPVKYVPEKALRLLEAKDFDKLEIEKKYVDSIFLKNEKYRPNKEYRFAFFINSPQDGTLHMKKKPKKITINPFIDCLVQ